MAISTESEALLCSNLRTNAMKVFEGARVATFKAYQLTRSLGGDEQVIRQGPGIDLKTPHVPSPW